MSKQEHRPKDETRALIVRAVRAAPGGLTRTQIASAVKRAKTPHLIDLIEELVQEGHLTKRVQVFGNGVEGYRYQVKDPR